MSFEKGTRIPNEADSIIALLESNGVTDYSVGTERNDVTIVEINSRDVAKIEAQLLALGFVKK